MSGTRLMHLLQKRLLAQPRIPFALKWWDGRSDRFGEGEPVFQIAIQDHRGRVALSRLDELAICEAYVAGFLDISGDMLQLMALRDALTDRHPLHRLWRRLSPLIVGQLRTDSRAVRQHYDVENDFHLIFMDPSRIYSHALFAHDDEPLETAQRRKLDFALEASNISSRRSFGTTIFSNNYSIISISTCNIFSICFTIYQKVSVTTCNPLIIGIHFI
jgi:cyclopropane-fatty-acyl-phospholipid synthase